MRYHVPETGQELSVLVVFTPGEPITTVTNVRYS